nr:MAG TPA: hypothetical protein [Caudoviricetes sp.]
MDCIKPQRSRHTPIQKSKKHIQHRVEKPKRRRSRTGIENGGGAFRKNKNAPKGGAPVIPSQKSGIRPLLRTGARRARLVPPPGADP